MGGGLLFRHFHLREPEFRRGVVTGNGENELKGAIGCVIVWSPRGDGGFILQGLLKGLVKCIFFIILQV